MNSFDLVVAVLCGYLLGHVFGYIRGKERAEDLWRDIPKEIKRGDKVRVVGASAAIPIDGWTVLDTPNPQWRFFRLQNINGTDLAISPQYVLPQ